MTDRRWRNWGRTEFAVPLRIVAPRSVDEVVHVVRAARAEATTVKAVGSGHSFSSIAVADGIQLDLRRLRGLVAADVDRSRVTLAAGTRLCDIPQLLAPFGLAMANLGDIDKQTLAGAIATGTHGTGAAFGGMSTQVVGATMVNGLGEVVSVTDGQSDVLSGVALGLGALGILVDITLQCVPAFALEATERSENVDTVLAAFADNVARNDHYEFYWFPHTDRTLTKANRRLPADTEPTGPNRLRRYIDDELLSNHALRAVCGLGAKVPRAVPVINTVVSHALSARTYIDRSAAVFASSRTVRFREMEYAVPIDAVPEAVTRIRDLIDRRGFMVSFPIEVRAAAADDLMLSTASGRATGYVAVHRYHRDRRDGYFGAVEEIMTDLGGRPHWGKMHTRDADSLRSVYPRFDEFGSLRDQLDPDRVFRNHYLDVVLGA